MNAVAECRGEALTDVADLPFARPAQLRLTELVMNAREEAIDIDLSLGAAGDASAELNRLTAEQPYRERLWELLALARYQHGRQAEALDAIKQARRLLRDEVGIDPNPRLAQIELAILRQEPTDCFLKTRPAVEPTGADLTIVDNRPAQQRPHERVVKPRSFRHRNRLTIVICALAVIAGAAIAIVSRHDARTPRVVAEGAVGVVDPDSGELLASVPIGRSIAGITSGDDHVFATDPSGRVLVQIDPRRRTTTRSFALEGDPWHPTAAGGHVFVPIGAGQVAKLDPSTGIVEQPLEPLGSNTGRVVVLGVGDQTWAVARTGSVGVLNQWGVATPVNSFPVSFDRVTGDGHRGWAVTDGALVELVSFSPSAVLTQAPLRGRGVDIAVGLAAVWVVTSEDNRLWRADPATGEVLGTLALPATPTDVVTTDETVWVSTASGQLLAIDPTGERITQTVDFGYRIVAITYGHSLLWVGVA